MRFVKEPVMGDFCTVSMLKADLLTGLLTDERRVIFRVTKPIVCRMIFILRN